MCFSAVASFTAAGVLTATGLYLGKKFFGNRRFLIAITPLLFGIQQFAEGWLWVALTSHQYPNDWSLFAEYVYLSFAYLFWPIWISLAFLKAEEEKKRKVGLKVLLFFGVLLSVLNGLYLFSAPRIEATVIGHSISYAQPHVLAALVYAIIVSAPFFVSSLQRMKIVGACVFLSFAVAFTAYTYAFTSIWCFVAALITLLLLFFL